MSDTIQANGQHEVEATDIPDAGYASAPEEIAEQMERAAEALGEDVESEPDHEAAESEDAWENRPSGAEWAMEQIIAVNQSVLDQKAVVKAKADDLKDEKDTLQDLQDELNRLILEAAKAKEASEPDPEKFPLFDKAAVNATFAKPDAIQPIPADDFAEAYRRLARDTKLADLDIPKRAVTAMAKAGYVTVADVGKLTEASAPLTSVKGIGEDAAEHIIKTLEGVSAQWWADWNMEQMDIALNPAEAVVEGEEGGGDE